MAVGVAGTPVGTPPIQFRSVGSDPLPVVTSTATIDAPLADLLDTPHAIVIESVDLEADARTTIACGNVGGVLTDDEVVFGLRSLLADTSGLAWLQGQTDGTTAVTLFVTQGLSAVEAGPGRTPVPGAAPPTGAAETPAAGPAATTEVTIGAYDIYFDPKEVTIPAKTDVTVKLSNNGATLHNFSVTDHNNPDVPNLGIDVDLAVGTTATMTINAPAGTTTSTATSRATRRPACSAPCTSCRQASARATRSANPGNATPEKWRVARAVLVRGAAHAGEDWIQGGAG